MTTLFATLPPFVEAIADFPGCWAVTGWRVLRVAPAMPKQRAGAHPAINSDGLGPKVLNADGVLPPEQPAITTPTS